MRNALADAGKSGRRVVSAFIGTAFAQDDAGAARLQWRRVADQLRPKLQKLADFLDEAVQRAGYMSLETIAPLSDDPTASLRQSPADRPGPRR